jgi:hypothetical protein
MSVRRLTSVVVTVLLVVLVPAALNAACPSPSTAMCPAECRTGGLCYTAGDPCAMCKYVGSNPDGCASWASCSCCEQMGLF